MKELCGCCGTKGTQIEWPTSEGRHEVILAEGEWMVNHCHVDPFRQHRIKGPGRLIVIIGKDGGLTTVYGAR